MRVLLCIHLPLHKNAPDVGNLYLLQIDSIVLLEAIVGRTWTYLDDG